MGSEGRIDWRVAGDEYIIKRVFGTQSSFGIVGNEESCALAYGKKYYLNIGRAYDHNVVPEQGGFTGGIIQRGDVVQCALRLESRRYNE